MTPVQKLCDFLFPASYLNGYENSGYRKLSLVLQGTKGLFLLWLVVLRNGEDETNLDFCSIEDLIYDTTLKEASSRPVWQRSIC